MSVIQQSRPEVYQYTTQVSQDQRVRLKGHKPCVIWMTGLSGAGKSTLANALEQHLNQLGCHTYLLDGDNLRSGLNRDLGFSPESREENIRRASEVASLFVDAGMIVIVAAISPYKADRDFARKRVSATEFIEVYINTPLDVCEQRDTKGLYKKARQGKIKEFTGIDSTYEPPINPELLIATDGISVAQGVATLMKGLVERKIIAATE